MSETAAERIKELQAQGWREAEILRQLEREFYDVSRRFVRNVMGTSTELRDDRIVESGRTPLSELEDAAKWLYERAETPADESNRLRRVIGQDYVVSPVVGLPDNAHVITDNPLHVNLDTFIAASDFHAPLHSRVMVQRLMNVAETERVDTLIIQGDLFDFDSASRFGRTEIQAGINETIQVAGRLLDVLCNVFGRIYIIPGNHCQRIAKKLDEPLSFELLVRAGVRRAKVSSDAASRAEIITSDYEYLYVGAEESGWVIGHPMKYARTPQKLGIAAMRERRSIIGSHTHLQTLMWSDDGRYRLIDPGHMTEPTMTPYVMRSRGLSTFAESKAGFVLVRNNIPQIMADGLVDWRSFGA